MSSCAVTREAPERQNKASMLGGIAGVFGLLFSLAFGCYHKFSFPISNRRGQRRSAAAARTGTYVVCLKCGKEFAYDWQRMKVIKK